MVQVACPECGSQKEENAQCNVCQLIKAAVAAASSNKGPSIPKFDLPQFSADQLGGIRAWFQQVEIRLDFMNMDTEDKKYNLLVAGLPVEIMNRVYDVIREKPTIEPYSTLKKKIIKEFEPTEDQQIQKLLEGMKIGNKKPTVFLREIKSLAKNRVEESVLRQMFLNQLPPVTSSVLRLSKTLTLDELAEAADEGWAREIKEVNEVKKESDSPEKPDDVVTKMIEALEKWHFSNRRSQSRGSNFQQRRRSQSRRRQNQLNLCWAHKKFGNDARTCRPWCKEYKGNAKDSS